VVKEVLAGDCHSAVVEDHAGNSHLDVLAVDGAGLGGADGVLLVGDRLHFARFNVRAGGHGPDQAAELNCAAGEHVEDAVDGCAELGRIAVGVGRGVGHAEEFVVDGLLIGGFTRAVGDAGGRGDGIAAGGVDEQVARCDLEVAVGVDEDGAGDFSDEVTHGKVPFYVGFRVQLDAE